MMVTATTFYLDNRLMEMRNRSRFFFVCVLFGIILGGINPVTAQTPPVSPYQLDGWRDGIWTMAGFAGSAYGLALISKKKGISEELLASEMNTKNRINVLDQWVVGNDSETANNISDIPFYASFSLPFLMLFDNEVNDYTGQVMMLYLKSLATTGAMYSITAGLVNRSRPYVYSEEQPLARRMRNNGQRSFYSGHVAASATASFFAAKVFTDLNPTVKGKGWIWAGATVVPVTVGYFRLKAGQHFLTDTILGLALGTATGILIPEWHKKKSEKLSLRATSRTTGFGADYQSIGLGIRI